MISGLLCAAIAASAISIAQAETLVPADADFSDPSQTRLIRDYPVKLDLTHAEGVQFDFLCRDYAPFHQFNCYLKSGDGWYALTMNHEERTDVQRIAIRKRDVKWTEGKVSGWHDISAVRIYGYRGNPLKARFSAGNFAALNDLPPKCGERRLLWCHSPWGLGYRDADWNASARMIRDMGFTDIIVSVAWANGACYKSDVLPPSPQFSFRKEDAFELCRAAARKYGLKFHAWMVCFNMGGHADAKAFDRLRAEGRVQIDGKGRANGRWLCPSHSGNVKQIVDALAELAAKGADGVHLDYIRYPDGDFCHCGRCREKAKSFPSWQEFRNAQIGEVVRMASDRIRREYPRVEISAAVRNTIGDSASRAVGQDWHSWCRNGWLDFVCPMDYFPLDASFRALVERQKQEVSCVKLYPGIGDINLWPDVSKDTSRIVGHIKAVREAGLDGFCFFDFGKRMIAAFKEIDLK